MNEGLEIINAWIKLCWKSMRIKAQQTDHRDHPSKPGNPEATKIGDRNHWPHKNWKLSYGKTFHKKSIGNDEERKTHL